MANDEQYPLIFTLIHDIDSDKQIPEVVPLMIKEAEDKIKQEKIEKQGLLPELRYLGDKLSLSVFRTK